MTTPNAQSDDDDNLWKPRLKNPWKPSDDYHERLGAQTSVVGQAHDPTIVPQHAQDDEQSFDCKQSENNLGPRREGDSPQPSSCGREDERSRASRRYQSSSMYRPGEEAVASSRSESSPQVLRTMQQSLPPQSRSRRARSRSPPRSVPVVDGSSRAHRIRDDIERTRDSVNNLHRPSAIQTLQRCRTGMQHGPLQSWLGSTSLPSSPLVGQNYYFPQSDGVLQQPQTDFQDQQQHQSSTEAPTTWNSGRLPEQIQYMNRSSSSMPSSPPFYPSHRQAPLPTGEQAGVVFGNQIMRHASDSSLSLPHMQQEWNRTGTCPLPGRSAPEASHSHVPPPFRISAQPAAIFQARRHVMSQDQFQTQPQPGWRPAQIQSGYGFVPVPQIGSAYAPQQLSSSQLTWPNVGSQNGSNILTCRVQPQSAPHPQQLQTMHDLLSVPGIPMPHTNQSVVLSAPIPHLPANNARAVNSEHQSQSLLGSENPSPHHDTHDTTNSIDAWPDLLGYSEAQGG